MGIFFLCAFLIGQDIHGAASTQNSQISVQDIVDYVEKINPRIDPLNKGFGLDYLSPLYTFGEQGLITPYTNKHIVAFKAYIMSPEGRKDIEQNLSQNSENKKNRIDSIRKTIYNIASSWEDKHDPILLGPDDVINYVVKKHEKEPEFFFTNLWNENNIFDKHHPYFEDNKDLQEKFKIYLISDEAKHSIQDYIKKQNQRGRKGDYTDSDWLFNHIIPFTITTYLDTKTPLPFVQQVDYFIARPKHTFDIFLQYLCGGKEGGLLMSRGPNALELDAFAKGLNHLISLKKNEITVSDIQEEWTKKRANCTTDQVRHHVDILFTALQRLVAHRRNEAIDPQSFFGNASQYKNQVDRVYQKGLLFLSTQQTRTD